jgi:hypothetical protein
MLFKEFSGTHNWVMLVFSKTSVSIVDRRLLFSRSLEASKMSNIYHRDVSVFIAVT